MTTAATRNAGLPLSGIRILDLTSVIMGPFATQMLAEYGADVVKLEPPEGDIMREMGPHLEPGMGPVYLNLDRGKRSVCLDLKQPESREVIARAAQASDVFVTNIWFWAATKRAVTETNTLLLSTQRDGRAAFRRSEDPGLIGPDSGWAWAGVLFDVEHDGDDDLYVANGFADYMTFVQYRPHPERPAVPARPAGRPRGRVRGSRPRCPRRPSSRCSCCSRTRRPSRRAS